MPRPALNVLVLCDNKGNDANVISDFLYSFDHHSRHRFFYLHNWSVNHHRFATLDLDQFDAILLFWDFYWVGSDNPFLMSYIPPWLSDRIAGARALKLMFLQDEYREVHLANHAMRRLGVNVMFSCVAPKDHEHFYPRDKIPSLIATYPVFTGYVPRYLEKIHCPASIDRPIDIGYRSRRLAYWLGSLGQEKSIIAERFQVIAQQHGFRADISVREKDRIYGTRWLDFLRSCRFSLGTESGASVVDFDGQIRKRCDQYTALHPDATFDDVKSRFFADVDGKIEIRTISPRVFEAAAFENTLVMHEGHYEGILQPDVHYIAVKPDYSNVPDVVARMKDRAYCERLARTAKERLIDSREFSYAAFVKSFDAILERHLPAPVRGRDASRTVFYFTNYLHDDRLMPVGSSCLRVPTPVDGIVEPKMRPAYFVTLYSLWLAFDLLAKLGPARRTLLSAIARHVAARPGDLASLLRDLRVLAFLRSARNGTRMMRSAPFAVYFPRHAESNLLRLTSQPHSADAPMVSASRDDERRTLRQIVAQGRVRLVWDHHLVGDTILLPFKDDNYCIFLNEEGTWHFGVLNELPHQAADEEMAVLTEVLFGEPSTPTNLAAAWDVARAAIGALAIAAGRLWHGLWRGRAGSGEGKIADSVGNVSRANEQKRAA